jgi:hypothetical protein
MDVSNPNAMTAYHWIFLSGFTICLIICSCQFIRTLFLTMPKEFAKSKGRVMPAIGYSFTKAMSPTRKETAYLHLPTYIGGLLYHLGTFLGLLLVFFFFFGLYPPAVWSYIFAALLAVSFISGASILFKRIVRQDMRALSNADDYISNSIVTVFHGLVGITLIFPEYSPVLFIYSTILLLYIPVGKLKHVVYFFTSRIYLSIFYGTRGVWPVEKGEA